MKLSAPQRALLLDMLRYPERPTTIRWMEKRRHTTALSLLRRGVLTKTLIDGFGVDYLLTDLGLRIARAAEAGTL